MVKLLIDHKKIEAEEGKSLLLVCRENDITVPSLCWLEALADPPASCRMCYVEVTGYPKPVTACTVRVSDGMEVHTDTPAVRRLQRTAFQLLLSVHDVSCKTCPANRKCELQNLARFLKVGLKQKRFDQHLKDPALDSTHPFLDLHINHCILCGKCIQVCGLKHGRPFLTFAKRGVNTVISYYEEPDISAYPCADCDACIAVCPVTAITLKA